MNMTRTLAAPVGDSPRRSSRHTVGRILTGIAPSIWVLLALVGYCAVLKPMLLQLPFQMVIFRQAAPLGLAVCAQLLVMRCRSIDLSLGGIFLLTNFVCTTALVAGLSPVWAIGLPLLAGAAVGAVNGLFITVFRASAVIVTLATGAILVGLVLYLSTDNAPGSVPQLVKDLGQGRVGPVPLAGLIWLAIALVLGVILRVMVFGRLMQAVGSNPQAATLSGLPIRRVLLASHVAAGALAAAGGLLLSGYVGVSTSNLGGDVVMNSIAGVILGGVTFGSGRGGMLGPTVAAFALTLLFNILNVFGAGESGKLIVQGLVIAAAAILAGMAQGRRR
jgi:ribose transport system permease protein